MNNNTNLNVILLPMMNNNSNLHVILLPIMNNNSNLHVILLSIMNNNSNLHVILLSIMNNNPLNVVIKKALKWNIYKYTNVERGLKATNCWMRSSFVTLMFPYIVICWRTYITTVLQGI